mmetsp:Transcript_33405/g.76947  ORF Transcript_33405/g.76947 Transcript_33405/m.76947 type:complete len:170 (+) Transcript_33405:59-568(+)
MSYYVGAEPKNPVQCEKFWRNRIDAEEGAAVRATANSTMSERSCPISWRRTTRPGSGMSQQSGSVLAGRGHDLVARGADVECSLPKASRVGTACSGISARTSLSATSCRSTVLSVELEIERERRQAAEREVEELRKKLDSMHAASSCGSNDRSLNSKVSHGSASQRSRR